MKIVWFSQKGNLNGGAEVTLVEAVRGLVAMGHEVHLVSPSPGKLCDLLQSMNVAVSIVPGDRWTSSGKGRALQLRLKRLWRNLRAGWNLSGLLRTVGPDLAVTNTITTPVGALAAKWAAVPHIWYVHEIFGKEGHDQFFDLGDSVSLALMNWLSARIIVNSCVTSQIYEKHIPSRKLRPVYCAVEVPSQTIEAPQASKHTFRLIQVGTMSAGKRSEDAIRALSLLVKKGLDVRLALVGRELPEYGRFLRGLAEELGVKDRVEFVAFTDPFPHFASSDLAVMCSRGESFGRATVEAMKMGIPVIGADSGATAELIQDGINGLLYRVGDVADLVQKIETLYHDRMLIRAMGQTAQDWAGRKFCTQAYMSDLLSVFEEALAAPAKPGRWQAVRRTAGRHVK